MSDAIPLTEGVGAPLLIQGVGARLPRKEDDRLMRGRGQYVGDLRLSGMQDVAFVRSPLAHARIRAIHVPEAFRDRVFTAADLTDVQPIRAVSGLPGFKVSEQPVLARDKVRQVGELLAICLAPTRAEAEDIAAAIVLDLEELPAVHEMLAAREPGAPLVHEHWGDNVFLETLVDVNLSAALDAPIKVSRTISTGRQCMAPIEGRGTVVHLDHRMDQLVVHTASQMPHIVRNGLSECLGIEQGRLRIVSPDVGGGFGYKAILLAEDVCLAWLALRVGHPVRWLEDRREHLTANANCREHHYRITAYAERDGRLRGIDCEATVDSGAYSAYPFSACLEAAQVASILPGPYDFPAYRCRTWSVATNKCPILPYRGVARTGVCFAMELILDAVATEAGLEPWVVREKNLVRPEQMPFDNITKKHFDSGDYPQALARVLKAIDVEAVRARQRAGEADGRRIGLGLSIYCEQAAHGTSVYSGWGIPMVPGHEQAGARLTPDGGLELRIGAHSHGQGLETTLAQVAHEILGVPVARTRLVHGDTAMTPYSTGSWGSRVMVMAGGAVAAACRELGERALRIGAHLLQADPAACRFEAGRVVGPSGDVTLAQIAHTWYRRPQDLALDVDPGGLEVTAGYKPQRDSGTFSYAAHAALVAVDPDLGAVEILDYCIVEDGGTLVNPLVVDGQIYGGLAQGIGTALYEEVRFDARGQPLASTFADYLLPGPAEVPEPRIDHMATPSPYTQFGVKGIGEGGAIAPPAALANAINDALRPLGVAMLHAPVSQHRIVEAVLAAREAVTAREAA
ncbi:xanthine dehydrogenase family protein molybdopterin-binding subunit [Methylobacterium sp. J-090]|uniref:xanthine dehydrogenase family protein molybdopterin-binding subunit n=1 Tax=Methylobacterium sp. J-090 TaxID=2836666 RepID=UPI001FB99EC9|nr:xanthine dehydrogenase family protein molybdopterin-binding subunit [Methylobacterium sp. J-090]MCJ2081352.1 xanthine dehydrogenase family protein molybdopterin-binding subunit [Methylobacterium sp. J-090]